ncbi:telomere length regulation protein TEL2 homolog [Pistacia vera]|uniref:telomere length regulation protein TEL2 homolog n=1 Tax=Pistacia vera TaxID=55513 RepID=UPI001263BD19|nr:telomere length regulation protein TEL2 homolog [Pistacia vera]
MSIILTEQTTVTNNSNISLLVVLCLLENNGVLQMAREFGVSCMYEDSTNDWLRPSLSRVAQLVASVPDKARLRAPTSLTSHLFFKMITIQLLSGLEERAANLSDKVATFKKIELDGTSLFVGETFSRICRRGSSDVLSSEVVLRVLRHVQNVLFSNSDVAPKDIFGSNPESIIWSKMMEAIKDPYAVERMSEKLLHQLAIDSVTDCEAYWIIWLLFHQLFHHQTSIRSMFVDKFLLWKVFPICCLRWILQFAVFECPPVAGPLTKDHETQGLLDTVQRLVSVWSKREFVLSATMEQQAYVSAALGLCLGKMSKEELDKTKDVMHLILQGVSCRLESPNDLVRKMASSVAFMFSKVIDPKHPLYLDDSCTGETIDWEFGITTRDKEALLTSSSKGKNLDKMITASTSMPEKDLDCVTHDEMLTKKKGGKNKLFENSIDPDEIIDPATLNYESVSDQDEDDEKASEDSDSSDSSLQPYDLSDDDNDLKKKISQLVDVVGALRKSDDADGAERALDVAEKLVRASPDELIHVAGDLVKTLVQVRCSDVAVEGEEESAEEKRHRALVALLVTCPFESLETLDKLLYSPNLDVSQRIMILDIMTEAAQELANSKVMKPKHQARASISTISETQPWFLPSSTGPPGASAWEEISETGTLLNWSARYERELPSKPGQIKKGKTRRWSLKSANIQENQMELSHNKFPVYAAAFMLPAMQGFDKKRHGVDLLGRDFIVLGKLIYMLGVCIKCASMHPEASALAPALLEMLKSREVCRHKEAYVRRAVLFAASCVLVALHPSFVASALLEGNADLSSGLEWIRSWALDVVDSDTDRDCYTLAMSCLQLHAEVALQASRALESAESTFKSKGVGLPSTLSKGTIIIPNSNVEY